MPLNLLMQDALAATPDKPAVIFEDTVLSYRELNDAIDRSARGLLSLGIGRGDRVAIFMRNRWEYVELYFACFRIGAVAVPLNHRFQTDEVEFAVDHCAAKLLIVDGPLLPVVQDVPSRSASLAGMYVYGDVPVAATQRWSGVVAAASDSLTWPEVDDDDPAMILYTSGSTGKPKGVTHTHRTIAAVAASRGTTQQLTTDDISLAATAICHAGAAVGVAFPALHAGGTVVILAESDPGLFLEALQTHRPTRTVLLPAQLLDAVVDPRAAGADFSCLREVECGGDQISPDLYEEFAKVTDLQLNQLYGLTECEAAAMNPPFGRIKRGSIGLPREGVEMRIVPVEAVAAGTDGTQVPDAAPGETGEIWIRSDSVMTGYWDDPEHTAATFAGDWLRTGDLGSRDDDGYLHFQGRINKRIKKLSRGQLSAVGVVIGLAARAEITFFDEPYLGLDAVARQIFYDRLLADYVEHPRTVILSSHLIDEVSNLIEKVLVIDRGRIVMDEDTDAVRDRAANIVGDAAAVDAFVAGREVIHRENLGRVASVTVLGALTPDDRARLATAGLDVTPVSLQQLIVRATQHSSGAQAEASATEEGALR